MLGSLFFNLNLYLYCFSPNNFAIRDYLVVHAMSLPPYVFIFSCSSYYYVAIFIAASIRSSEESIFCVNLDLLARVS